jgi:HAMP domain-containing protein
MIMISMVALRMIGGSRYAYAHVELPRHRLQAYGLASIEFIISSFHFGLYTIFVIIALFSIVFALILARSVRRLTRPMRGILAVMRKVSRGDFSARLEVRTGDELEEIAASLNALFVEAVRVLKGSFSGGTMAMVPEPTAFRLAAHSSIAIPRRPLWSCLHFMPCQRWTRTRTSSRRNPRTSARWHGTWSAAACGGWTSASFLHPTRGWTERAVASVESGADASAVGVKVEEPNVGPGFNCRGLALPDAALCKIFHDNALRWYPGLGEVAEKDAS